LSEEQHDLPTVTRSSPNPLDRPGSKRPTSILEASRSFVAAVGSVQAVVSPRPRSGPPSTTKPSSASPLWTPRAQPTSPVHASQARRPSSVLALRGNPERRHFRPVGSDWEWNARRAERCSVSISYCAL